MPDGLLQAIQDYYDTRTAIETGLTVEQVRTLNLLEERSDSPLDLERLTHGVYVEMVEDGWRHVGVVLPDGTVDWRYL